MNAQRDVIATGSGEREFTFVELRWFSDNAYNYAVTYTGSWTPIATVRLFQVALAFLDLFPSDIGQGDSDLAAIQRLRCTFGAAACLIATARARNSELQADDYDSVRRHVSMFHIVFDQAEKRLEEDKSKLDDMANKMASLLVWDFEAAIALGQWQDLSEIVRRARICRNAGIFREMADCIVRERKTAPQGMSIELPIKHDDANTQM